MSTELSFTDTHVHLDLIPSWREDLPALRKMGIRRFLVPDVSFSLDQADLVTAEMVFPMWGCHPAYAGTPWREPEGAMAAVGECGLEPGSSPAVEETMEAIFRRQIRLASVRDLPLDLHCIRRQDRILRILEEEDFRGRAVIHGFSGSIESARRWLDRGGILGIGPLILDPRCRRLRDSLVAAGPDHILLETDAPVFRRSSPGDLLLVAECCASLLGISLEDVSRRTEATADRIFFSADHFLPA